MVEDADTEVLTVTKSMLSVEARISDLLAYKDGQKKLALAAEEIASNLIPLCQLLLNYLQENPSEISPRMLPQMVKCLGEISKVASDCWTRSTGIEGRIRDEVVVEIDDRKKAFNLLAGCNSKEIQELVRLYYPIRQDEKIRSKAEIETDEFLSVI